ncbi:MAG: phytase [Thermoanaerobaculia bacterium]
MRLPLRPSDALAALFPVLLGPLAGWSAPPLRGAEVVNKALASPTTPLPWSFRYKGIGGEVDSVAVWIAPDPDGSLLFVTHKSANKVSIWNLNTNARIAELTGFSNPNGVAVDQPQGAVYVTDRHHHEVKKYFVAAILGGGLQPAASFASESYGFDASPEPMGVAVGHADGQSLIYVTYVGSSARFVRVFQPDGTLARSWRVAAGALESIAVDDANGRVFVADEGNDLVKVYRPDGGFVEDIGVGVFGGSPADPEGIAIYACGDDGYIIISDQKVNEFEVFDRKSLLNLARFSLQDVYDTDGITLTQVALASYPQGGFFVQSADRDVMLVRWETIALAMGMTICTDGAPPSTNLPPVVAITASPASGPAPLRVAFAATASDADGQVVSYRWDFGDRSTSLEQNPVHTYASPGSYDVRLEVADDGGATAVRTATVTAAAAVDVTPPAAPKNVRVVVNEGG